MQRQSLSAALADYAKHYDAGPQASAVRAFQADALLARHGRDPVLVFFADEILRGPALGELAADPAGTEQRLSRLLRDTRSAAATIEFIALSARLDAALAQRLPNPDWGNKSYVAAYRDVGEAEARERQLDLVAFVARDLAGIANSRLAYMGFKLARGPVRSAGLASLYDLLAAGFAAMRASRDLQSRVPAWLDAERTLVTRLLG